MIDWLRVVKSAYFYRKRKRLPKAAIVELFRDIRQNSKSPSSNIFRHVKESVGRASWSAISYFYERDPAFLEMPHGHTLERVCGFILLVEHREFAVLFKSGLDLPAGFKTEYLQRVGNDRVEGAIARVDATFEQIRLRNMATSKYALRSKTLEANDLQSVVGPSGANRYVPQGYRVRRGADHYSATPNTGRISLRSDRSGHEELVRWSLAEIDRLIEQNAEVSPFIRTFARPIDLGSIPTGVSATYLAINVAALTEELFEAAEPMRLVRRAGGDVAILDKASVDAVLAALDQSFAIRTTRTETKVVDPRNDSEVGTIVVGKTRISLRAFTLPEFEDIYIEPANSAAGEEDTGTPLKRYIDRNDLFTVLFSDFALAYIDGALYRDDLLSDGGGNFLRYIRANARLNGVTSEKGTFSAGHRSFDEASVFGAVVESIAEGDEALICDDLGDEWADFIGINGRAQPKTISFYHAKHGDLSLGASPFHVAVSQAIKNLGRMTLTAEAIVAKLPTWARTYSNNNVQTLIPRLIRGDAAALEQTVADARLSPDTIRRVFIVTSSLSRRRLEQTLADIASGAAPEPHFVQLYWLLTSYFSACAEVGAYAYVVCQE